jgi:FAD:protein FMN transferase
VPLVALVWIVTGAAPRSAPHLYHQEANRLSMACVYAIDAYGPDAAALPRILDDAFDEVDRIDRLMSHYKADSPISRVNRQAARRPVVVEPELFDFIAEAMRYNRESGGAFDITVGPLMKAWGFFGGEGRMPADEELTAARRHVGAAHVVLNPIDKTIAFDEQGVELDLGGIAKGYAVDRVVGLLRQRQIAAALVSAGGSTIYGLGAPPGHDGWTVAIQDPIDSRTAALTVTLEDRALSVAGSSEKSFESGGVRYSHIMDPRTGRPVQGMLSVAVLASSGTAGDALDDALFVMGEERSRAYLKKLPDTEAFFFLPASAREQSERVSARQSPDAPRAWTVIHRHGGRVKFLLEATP